MTKKISRRDFLGATAAAGAATLVAPSLLGVTLAEAAAAQRRAAASPRPLKSFDPQVREVLARMTLEEKVGQMTQPEQDALKELDDIRNYSVGSLLSGGNSDPKRDGVANNSLQAWTDMYDRYQTIAMKSRLGIPILYGVDAVHGHNNVIGAVVFPHNIGLGCTRNARLVEQSARVTAEEVRATGIQWTFAPCVTVPRDERWGYLMTDVLKREMGFDGFLISDYNAIDQITKDYKQAIAISINAGMDMVMVPQRYREFFDLLTALVKEGAVPQSRIDDAVTRILRVKFAMGMMDKNRSQLADRRLHSTFGSAAHRQVARECVRQSLVLLKNNRRALPLRKTAAHIHVAGRSADDIGNQCGGWTIEWQGKSGDVTTGGTTILQAIQNTVSKQTKVTYTRDGTSASGAGVGIVVIGETPYAEGVGDRDELSLSAEDVAAVENLKRAGLPVVAVLVTGRPLILEPILAKCDAVVAAWLPGTEGQGVADVLFGDYRPTGKLSFSWPRTNEQIPVNVGDRPYNPLFRYGFGLSY
ncbi:MAG: glycoside hydrolase family 3 C-terminal domain-containing protein [Acidobacteria bacterium]|nr:glycoside hydrolase family 3 C-terminal domain-containing protein [Acidobacteriota bacterium]